MAELVTVAVDANGADLGPAEVARGAALAAGADTRVLLFGPAAEMEAADGVEIVDTPFSIAKASEPAKAARSNPEASIVQAARAVAEGRADALVSGGSTGAALAAGLFEIKRARGVHRPALTLTIPVPGSPVLLIDVGANTEARPEHLVQFAYMGAAFAQGVLGIEAPRIGLLSNGEEPTRGSAVVIDAHERLSTATGLDFVGNVEGTTLVEGVADVVVTDGFTGNVTVKLMEGTTTALLNAIREAATSSPRGKAGGLLLRARAERAAQELRRRRGRQRLPARAAQPRCHLSRPPDQARVPARDRGRGAGRARARRAAHLRCPECRWSPAGRVRARRYGHARPMTREEVYTLIRTHLGDELGIDQARIVEATRFKEDLEADSLDLYELVMELEDTYGVRISDEDAARILTVGQAVDFVVAHEPAGRESRP